MKCGSSSVRVLRKLGCGTTQIPERNYGEQGGEGESEEPWKLPTEAGAKRGDSGQKSMLVEALPAAFSAFHPVFRLSSYAMRAERLMAELWERFFFLQLQANSSNHFLAM